MALSEADKQRIVEEEQLRANARAEAEKKNKQKGTSCVTWIVFFLIVGCFLSLLFSKALNDQVSENVENLNGGIEFNNCIDEADRLTQEAKDIEYKLCANEYKSVLQIGYDNCKTNAQKQNTQEFIERELQKCEDEWGKYLKLAE